MKKIDQTLGSVFAGLVVASVVAVFVASVIKFIMWMFS